MRATNLERLFDTSRNVLSFVNAGLVHHCQHAPEFGDEVRWLATLYILKELMAISAAL